MMTQPEIDRLIAKAFAHADKIGIRVAVAVCDPGGRLAALRRMDGVIPVATTAVVGKARAASIFGLPTSLLASLQDNPNIQALAATEGGLLLASGGLPFHRDGGLVAGFAVSGGTGEQDEACAKAALEPDEV